MELTERQWQTIEVGREPMREAIAERYSQDLAPLFIVAITGSFADICSAGIAIGEPVVIINRQLAGNGLEFVPISHNYYDDLLARLRHRKRAVWPSPRRPTVS